MDFNNRLVSVQVDDDTVIYAEATLIDPEQEVAFSRGSFEDVMKPLESVCRSFSETMRKVKPAKASIEFGVELGVESGALTTLFAKGTGSANFKVTLQWESGSAKQKDAAPAP